MNCFASGNMIDHYFYLIYLAYINSFLLTPFFQGTFILKTYMEAGLKYLLCTLMEYSVDYFKSGNFLFRILIQI